MALRTPVGALNKVTTLDAGHTLRTFCIFGVQILNMAKCMLNFSFSVEFSDLYSINCLISFQQIHHLLHSIFANIKLLDIFDICKLPAVD